MELKNFAVKPTTTASATGNGIENRAGRVAKMKAFWNKAENAILYPVGQLLSTEVNGKSLAEWMVAGESFEMESLAINGRVLPLVKGFRLSLKTIEAWGCPACGSAHGSGVAPSRKMVADLLAANVFYYSPVSKALFTISATCWGDYVKALGAITSERFPTEVPALVVNKPVVNKPVAA